MKQIEYPNFKEEKIEKEQNKALKWLYAFFIFLFILVFTFLIGRTIFYANYKFYPVRGTSMQPTINPDITSTVVEDGVFVKYDSPFDYEDIVIIQLPGQTNTIIKRVIAKEGDKVSIRRHPELNNQYRVSIIRDGESKIEILEEGYIKGYSDWSINESYSYNHGEYSVEYESEFYYTYLNQMNGNLQVSVEADGCLYYEIAENNFFYLGDNRRVSKDARANGTAEENQIVGVVKMIVRDIENNPTVRLWWKKFKTVVGYMIDQITNFFAWKY